MILTVVVPTIPGRETLLSRCLFHLLGQAPADRVEVLVVDGRGSLGDKVNAAAARASGGWMTVVDDDDWLSGDYMAHVLPALEADPDYVGLSVLEMDNGKFAGLTATTGELGTWNRGGPRRGPVPKGVTRSSIWRACPMGNHYSADRAWMVAAKQHIKTWVDVDRPLYVYDYWSHSFGTAGARDVGLWPFNEDRVVRFSL